MKAYEKVGSLKDEMLKKDEANQTILDSISKALSHAGRACTPGASVVAAVKDLCGAYAENRKRLNAYQQPACSKKSKTGL